MEAQLHRRSLEISREALEHYTSLIHKAERYLPKAKVSRPSSGPPLVGLLYVTKKGEVEENEDGVLRAYIVSTVSCASVRVGAHHLIRVIELNLQIESITDALTVTIVCVADRLILFGCTSRRKRETPT